MITACKNSVESISQKLTNVFRFIIPSAPKVPAAIMALGAPNRRGLNKHVITSRIISRFPEVGLVNGDGPDGSKNSLEGLVALIVEEIIDSIKTDARVDAAANTRTVNIMSTGGNVGGPIVTQGYNMTPFNVFGVIR